MNETTTHDPNVPVADGELIEVARGIHAWIQPDGTWWINNAGFVAEGSTVAVIDTCTTEKRTRQFFTAMERAIPGATVKFAVNTHHHGDHTFGNSLLPQQTCLIGHELMRSAFLEDTTLEAFPDFWSPTPNFGDLTRRAPDLTILETATIYLEARPLQIAHPGFTAHTEGDLGVWIPDARVLFVGDLLFPGHTPMIMAGAPTGAIRSLAWISAFEPSVVVPGHGPLIQASQLAAVLDEHRAYYEFVISEAKRGVAQHLTPLEVARTADMAPYRHLLDPERFVLNIHSAYAELGLGQVNRPKALADAVALIGGGAILTRA